MFTGIIEAIGKVREPEPLGDGVRLTIETPAGWLKGTEIGESIAVNGACMTVVKIEGDTFQIEVSAESLSKTCGLNTAESWHLVVRAPMKLSQYLAYKGSITVNGVSLTINSVEDTPAGTRVSINLIPHTVEVTTLKHLKPQDWVNLEIDTIARYVERMMSLRNDDSLF